MTPLESKQHQSEVLVGQLAPDFSARDLDNNTVNLKSLVKGRKALLVFYRGGWCPYCNQQLASISQDFRKFNEAGATVVAVSGEEVERERIS